MSEHPGIHSAAEALRRAAEQRTPCPPIRDLIGDLIGDPIRNLMGDPTDIGYAIQQINTDLAVGAGRRITGRKIGITSPAVMEQIGVTQPDFGTLFADMEYGDGVALPADRLLQPRAEAEVALVLERDLDRGEHSFTDIISATAYALAAIEVVDSRVAGWDITIVDTVADNASCGLYVLSGRPVRLDRIDLRTVTMSMSINGAEVSTGVGSACLGHPLNAARWLADTMSARGTPLRAGDVVMTGALGPMRPITTGDTIEVRLGDLGTVTTYITAPDPEASPN